jgi:polysaccharide pyruvyl transferase WcaK-like protein
MRPILFICGDLHNLGDLALLMQNLELARTAGREARVRRWQPLPPAIEQQVSAAGGTLFDGRSAKASLAAAWGADMVIGGGQLIRGNVSGRSLLSLVMMASAIRISGGRITCRGLGVSRIASAARQKLWRAVFGMADRIAVRDIASQANIASLAAPAKIVLTADMAFLDSALHGKLPAGTVPADGTIVIAPCIDPSEGRSIEGPAIERIVAAATRRLGHQRIAYACHDPRPGMDCMAAERLASLLPSPDTVIHDSYDLDALFTLYGEAGLVVTNRLHASIFSILSNRPVLVIDDGTHKIAAIADRFGIVSIDAKATPTAAEADRLVEQAISFDANARAIQRRKLATSASRNLA